MTNPVITQIHAHRSIRAYKAEPVPDTLIETIVAAGQRASTSSNLQLTTVIAVREADRRAQLAAHCGDQAHIRQAPVFLAWCADLRRLELACTHQGYTQETGYVENFLVAAVDAAIMMQTAALAAEALGLGICYIGGIRNQPQAVIELLGLPRLVFPISGMTVGWPDAEPMLRPRLGLDAILHWEQYLSLIHI
jgi:FMN reductase (NADPH)